MTERQLVAWAADERSFFLGATYQEGKGKGWRLHRSIYFPVPNIVDLELHNRFQTEQWRKVWLRFSDSTGVVRGWEIPCVNIDRCHTYLTTWRLSAVSENSNIWLLEKKRPKPSNFTLSLSNGRQAGHCHTGKMGSCLHKYGLTESWYFHKFLDSNTPLQ